MNTNMTGFRWFPKMVASFCLDESSLSIGRVKRILVDGSEKRRLSLHSACYHPAIEVAHLGEVVGRITIGII